MTWAFIWCSEQCVCVCVCVGLSVCLCLCLINVSVHVCVCVYIVGDKDLCDWRNQRHLGCDAHCHATSANYLTVTDVDTG